MTPGKTIMWSLVTLARARAEHQLRLGSREKGGKELDNKYRQHFRKSFVIKGTKEMKQFLEEEIGPRKKQKNNIMFEY